MAQPHAQPASPPHDAGARPALLPFAAIRAASAHAQAIIAPPYDVPTVEEARTLAAGNPLSFLHASRAEIDFPPGQDPHADEVYAAAGAAMRRLLAEGALVRDPAPAYYAWRMQDGAHVQTGVAAAASVAAYEAGIIRRHELTRPDKVEDRVRQIEAVAAHTGPVMAVHRSDAEIAAVIAASCAAPAAVAATAPDGVAHALWPIAEAGAVARLTAAFAAHEAVYIADGHHRSEAAAVLCRRRASADPAHRGDESHARFLLVSFPDDEVRILDYNRLVRDLGGLTPAAFLAAVGERFEVAAADGPARPAAPHRFGLYVAGQWYRLALREAPPRAGSPTERLDVSLLAERLLAPVLGIGDPRTDPRIDFAGGARGLDWLAARVDSGEMAAAFALYPTALEDLMAVADAGEIMPPKSTWFEPKLADGLLSLPIG